MNVWDDGAARQLMLLCPFYGAQLPEPLREAWFERLDELNPEPDSEEVPMEMRSGA